jgi:hypothetical protein
MANAGSVRISATNRGPDRLGRPSPSPGLNRQGLPSKIQGGRRPPEVSKAVGPRQPEARPLSPSLLKTSSMSRSRRPPRRSARRSRAFWSTTPSARATLAVVHEAAGSAVAFHRLTTDRVELRRRTIKSAHVRRAQGTVPAVNPDFEAEDGPGQRARARPTPGPREVILSALRALDGRSWARCPGRSAILIVTEGFASQPASDTRRARASRVRRPRRSALQTVRELRCRFYALRPAR